jgi:hypothetical protein
MDEGIKGRMADVSKEPRRRVKRSAGEGGGNKQKEIKIFKYSSPSPLILNSHSHLYDPQIN